MPKKNKNKYPRKLIFAIIFFLFFVVVYFLIGEYCLSPALEINNKHINSQPEVVSFDRPLVPFSEVPQTSGSPLVFSSFFDSFASDYLIDLNRTNLYRDNVSAAIMFPPDYSWREVEETEIDEKIISESKKYLNTSFEKRCLGDKCLERKGSELIYQGRTLVLPPEIKGRNLSAVTIGVLDNRWLVGFTRKVDDKYQSETKKYQGVVYYFDGKEFTLLLNDDKFSSPYSGLFGFGGRESDFLVIYGAYRGIAYRVRDNQITDVSKFFDYRTMDKGFRPEVIRVEAKRQINWYVFSLTPEKPKLIKLWPDKNNEIVGEILYQDIFYDVAAGATFSFLNFNDGEINLLAKIKSTGMDSGEGDGVQDSLENESGDWKIFSDRGFKNQLPGELVFNPISTVSPGSKIIIKKLANSSLGLRDAPCLEATLSFSQDQKTWYAMPQGYYLNKDFGDLQLDTYFLKVNFPAQVDKFYSPFLTEVLFDFYYQTP